MKEHLTPEDSKLLQHIAEMGAGSYHMLKMLEDGTIVGIGPLLFTMAIYIDMDAYGYGSRYCFENPALALEQYHQLQTGDDIPQGYNASRSKVV